MRKRILVLRTQNEHSVKEIADQLDVPKFIVKKHLNNGLTAIRSYIHQLNDGAA